MSAAVSELRKCIVFRQERNFGSGFSAFIYRLIRSFYIAKILFDFKTVFAKKLLLPCTCLVFLQTQLRVVMDIQCEFSELRC